MRSKPAGAVDPIPPTIEWRRDAVRLLDQRALQARLRFVVCADVDDLVDAISTLAVRGAPALGAAGAFGVALAAHTLRTKRQVRAAASGTRNRSPLPAAMPTEIATTAMPAATAITAPADVLYGGNRGGDVRLRQTGCCDVGRGNAAHQCNDTESNRCDTPYFIVVSLS